MNLKKWGSLLTAIAMVGSMAASLPVSAAEPATIKSGTLLGGNSSITYEYYAEADATANIPVKTLVLKSDINGTVIPVSAFTPDKGFIQDIIDDGSIANASAVENVIIDTPNIDGIAPNAFVDFNAATNVQIHCQSDMANSLPTINVSAGSPVTKAKYDKYAAEIKEYSMTSPATAKISDEGYANITDQTDKDKFDSASNGGHAAANTSAALVIKTSTFDQLTDADKLLFGAVYQWKATKESTTDYLASTDSSLATSGNCVGIKTPQEKASNSGAAADKYCYVITSDTKNDTTGGTPLSGTVSLKHNEQVDTVRHTHSCAYGDYFNNKYSAHDFTKEGGATIANGVHTCKCGKTDKDYYDAGYSYTENIQLTKDGSAEDNYGYDFYQDIHTFNQEGNHKCSVCGTYDLVRHNGKPESTDPVFAAVDGTLVYAKSADEKTHSLSCSNPDCKHTQDSASHSWQVLEKHNGLTNTATSNITVNGQTIQPEDHYCEFCGHKDNTRHAYNYMYKPEQQENGSYKLVIVPADTADHKVVCKCGKVNPDFATKPFDVLNEKDFHYTISGVISTQHGYIYNKNENGDLIMAGTGGTICSCGKVDSLHSSHTYDVYNTTDNTHRCKCGEIDPASNPHTYDQYDDVNHVHKCLCGKINPASNGGHSYTKGYEITGGALTAKNDFSDPDGFICDLCGKESDHPHTYNLVDTVDHKHYCACGKEAPDGGHTYNLTNGIKCACGAMKDHTDADHVTDDNCKCKICGETAHDYAKYGTQDHICQKCGVKQINAGHKWVPNKTTKEHECSICGKVNGGGHTLGTTGADKCICQECGAVQHGSTTLQADKSHKCDRCEMTVAHVYDETTHKCDINGFDCKKVDPKHTNHTFYITDGTVDKCICETPIDHVLGLVSDNAAQHVCQNVYTTIVTNAGNPTTTSVSSRTCAVSAVTHNFNIPATTKAGEVQFCECGAVNPDALNTVRSLGVTDTYNDLVNSHTASYMVDLCKKAAEVAKYDIKKLDDPATDETASAKDVPADVAAVKLAKTDAEKTEFNALLKAFNDAYTKRTDTANEASIYVGVEFIDPTKAAVEQKVLEDQGAVLDGSVYKIFGQVNTTVTLKAVAKPGFVFEGWYKTGVVSAANKLSNMGEEATVTIGNTNTTYYANFVPAELIEMTIPGDLKYTASASNPGGTTLSLPQTVKFYKGETVTIELGSTLKGAVDGGNAIAVLKDKSENVLKWNNVANNAYSFVVERAETIKLETYDTSSMGGEFYVVFNNNGGTKILAQGTTTSHSAEGFAPKNPTMEGYTFLGWKNGDTFIRTNNITANCTLVPGFKAITGLKLKVEGGRFNDPAQEEKNENGGFSYGEAVGVVADVQNTAGKYFSGWYVNDKLVSQQLAFAYNLKTTSATTTIVAKYDRDSELVPESTASMSLNRTKLDSGLHQVVMNGSWAMADKDVSEILEVGILYGTNTYDATTMDLDAVDGSNVLKYVANTTGQSGNWTLTQPLGTNSSKRAFSARTYVSYKDASGKTQVKYSDVVVAKVADAK